MWSAFIYPLQLWPVADLRTDPVAYRRDARSTVTFCIPGTRCSLNTLRSVEQNCMSQLPQMNRTYECFIHFVSQRSMKPSAHFKLMWHAHICEQIRGIFRAEHQLSWLRPRQIRIWQTYTWCLCGLYTSLLQHCKSQRELIVWWNSCKGISPLREIFIKLEGSSFDALINSLWPHSVFP